MSEACPMSRDLQGLSNRLPLDDDRGFIRNVAHELDRLRADLTAAEVKRDEAEKRGYEVCAELAAANERAGLLKTDLASHNRQIIDLMQKVQDLKADLAAAHEENLRLRVGAIRDPDGIWWMPESIVGGNGHTPFVDGWQKLSEPPSSVLTERDAAIERLRDALLIIAKDPITFTHHDGTRWRMLQTVARDALEAAEAARKEQGDAE